MSARPEHRYLWVAGVLGALFALLTWNVVAGGGLAGFDDDVERVVVAHRVGWVTSILKILTWLGSSLVLWPVVGLVAAVLVARGRRRREALFVLLAMGGSVLLSDLVKALVDRPRPPPALRLADVSGAAYPSGHSMDALAVFVAIALVMGAGTPVSTRWLLAVIAAVVIAVVGWSRIYLGTHWLTDVLGAYLLAGAWVAALGAVLLRPRAEPARTERYPPDPGP